jgi:hypothetical protein
MSTVTNSPISAAVCPVDELSVCPPDSGDDIDNSELSERAPGPGTHIDNSELLVCAPRPEGHIDNSELSASSPDSGYDIDNYYSVWATEEERSQHTGHIVELKGIQKKLTKLLKQIPPPDDNEDLKAWSKRRKIETRAGELERRQEVVLSYVARLEKQWKDKDDAEPLRAAAHRLRQLGWSCTAIHSELLYILRDEKAPRNSNCSVCGTELTWKSTRCLKCSGLAPITYEPGHKFPGTDWEFVEYLYTNKFHSGRSAYDKDYQRRERNAKLRCLDCSGIFTVRLQSVRAGVSKRCRSCARKAVAR